jgi:hypothetical protein
MNDNFSDEEERLLAKAREIISEGKAGKPTCAPCPLFQGKACPLLSGMAVTLKDMLTQP